MFLGCRTQVENLKRSLMDGITTRLLGKTWWHNCRVEDVCVPCLRTTTLCCGMLRSTPRSTGWDLSSEFNIPKMRFPLAMFADGHDLEETYSTVAAEVKFYQSLDASFRYASRVAHFATRSQADSHQLTLQSSSVHSRLKWCCSTKCHQSFDCISVMIHALYDLYA